MPVNDNFYLKSLIKELQKEYEKTLKAGAKLIRKGDIDTGNIRIDAAERIKVQMDKLKAEIQ